MRYVIVVLAVLALIWFGWLRVKAGPPEAVVDDFLRAAQSSDWGTAQAYMTGHMRGRIGQEGFGGMQRFVEARLEPFETFEIVRVTPRGDEVDVIVRLLLPVRDREAHEAMQQVGAHGHPGRIEGNQFVHAHRFQLQQEGRAWRIYQFEEVDERLPS